MEPSVGMGTAGNDIGVVYGRTISKIAGGGGNVGGREGRGDERAGGGGGTMSGNDGIMFGKSVTGIAGG
jgi:hypothetical protein